MRLSLNASECIVEPNISRPADEGGSDGADFISGGPDDDSVIYSTRTDDLNIDLSDGSKATTARPAKAITFKPMSERLLRLRE